jgi:ATP-binding protein involved in chromosome partitioning
MSDEAPEAPAAKPRRLRTYAEVSEPDRSNLLGQVVAQRERVTARLAGVRDVVAVVSGKGGVGKSLVSAGLAAALARGGSAIGLLDADLHGPTAARMLGVRDASLVVRDGAVEPRLAPSGVRVMSSDLLLPEGAPLGWREPGHDGFVWRGSLAAGMLREFLGDVAWGRLELLLVDMPPGTERLDTLAELVPGLAGIVVVTIPSEASYRAVKRAVEAARQRRIPILGVVENMAGYRCGGCRADGPLFAGDAGDRLARETGGELLARIPFDPAVQAGIDQGDTDSAATALAPAAEALVARLARAAASRPGAQP